MYYWSIIYARPKSFNHLQIKSFLSSTFYWHMLVVSILIIISIDKDKNKTLSILNNNSLDFSLESKTPSLIAFGNSHFCSKLLSLKAYSIFLQLFRKYSCFGVFIIFDVFDK